MINNPEVFVNSAEEGVAKVKKGGFAYILESTTNDYLRSKDCELIQIGGKHMANCLSCIKNGG